MEPTIQDTIAAVRDLLDQADRGRDVNPALTNGRLIIAISRLTDAVEQLSERHEHLADIAMAQQERRRDIEASFMSERDHYSD